MNHDQQAFLVERNDCEDFVRADLHEALVRELAEARDSDAESIAMFRRVRDERDKLRALLDEAPHTHNCDGWAWEINPCLGTWEPEYVRVMHDEKCSCYRSRIPRAGG